MPFVPNFDCDVFISYSHVDNEEVRYGGDKMAWVGCLKEELETRVRQDGIGRDLHVWMDHRDLPENEPVTPTLVEAVKRAAVLVIILSENYLQSEWCMRECETFVESTRKDDRFGGRVFVVHYDELPLEARPAPLRDLLGFSFYDQETHAELDPRNDCYTKALLKLREKIASKLKEMRKTIEDGKVAPDERPTVFLAEGTPDLDTARDQLETFIESLGYRVLPATFYNRDGDSFRQAAEEDLARNCKLFLQWLGPFASRRTTTLPMGYEGVQWEVAREAGVPVLRAYQRETIDFGKVSEPSHRAFLEAADVMALDLEEFKRRIDKTLGEIKEKEEMSTAATATGVSNGAKSILIQVCAQDRPAALRIKDRLAQGRSFGFEIVDQPEVFQKLTKFYDFDGLVVVFGEQASDDWVAEWMRSCAFYRLEKSPHEPACAVYLDPGENRRRLLSDPEFFRKIENNNGDAELARFLSELEHRKPA